MSEFDATIGAVDLEPEAPPTQVDHEFWRIYAAEALGTFFLVLLGCGAAVATNADVVATGLTFGIAVLISATAFARISGGHFNPAVTVGAATSGRLSWRETPVYFGAQLSGAIVAALVLFVILHAVPGFDATGHMGQNGFGDHSGVHLAWWGAFLIELILTALFLWIILGVTDERTGVPTLAPVAIGLTLAAIHFVAIPLTGTSVNPARSIGPALFAGVDAIAQLWLFILAPLLGAVLAGVTYPLLFGRDSEAVPGSGIGALRSLAARRPARPAGSAAASGAAPTGWSQERESTSETTYNAGAQWPQRIVQDGWEWDYAAQQWKPVQEEPPTQS
ncbi:aquaporin [Nocardioides sp. Kera G14]|uniref:aquaporin n=1 Tax=Nocardioides sp. Kera G14 TaxID=2884264 RepID=UPI001D10C872|nr:aquaporin [Nocardioides sp. Kera G14]UDY24377.1 aquaporin [Nocardioides sp. Kera G14]